MRSRDGTAGGVEPPLVCRQIKASKTGRGYVKRFLEKRDYGYFVRRTLLTFRYYLLFLYDSYHSLSLPILAQCACACAQATDEYENGVFFDPNYILVDRIIARRDADLEGGSSNDVDYLGPLLRPLTLPCQTLRNYTVRITHAHSRVDGAAL